MSQIILEKTRSNSIASKLAVADAEVSLSYRELNRRSDAVALELRNAGVHPGDTVGLLAPSSVAYVEALLAIWKVGAMAVPLQPAHPIAELEYIGRDSRIQRILFHQSNSEVADRLAKELGIRLIEIARKSSKQVAFGSNSIDSNSNALLIYTSGTTKRPKGVPTSIKSLDAQIDQLLSAWRWSENDRTINVLPLHHVHGVVNVLCCALAAGASCEMAPKFDAEVVWSRIATGQINVFMAVPTVYDKLLESWRRQDTETQKRRSEAARAMRLMVSGSAALPVPLFEMWERITGHRLLERYGMTEIGMALSNPYEGHRCPGRVGMPLAHVQVRLVGDDGKPLNEPDSPGEIQVKGQAVFKGYWHLKDATREAFTEDGWFKTGDLAEFDGAGSYRILGRLSQDIIKSGGYKISALEIESVLLEHPAIAEVAVVGLPDEKWGERVAAVYVNREGLTPSDDEYQAFLRERLAHYKVPSRWLTTARLPRNAMGKVVKAEVRRLFGP